MFPQPLPFFPVQFHSGKWLLHFCFDSILQCALISNSAYFLQILMEVCGNGSRSRTNFLIGTYANAIVLHYAPTTTNKAFSLHKVMGDCGKDDTENEISLIDWTSTALKNMILINKYKKSVFIKTFPKIKNGKTLILINFCPNRS